MSKNIIQGHQQAKASALHCHARWSVFRW